MILLWGLMEDGPLAAVAARLDAIGAAWAFVDQRQTLECSARVDIDQSLRGELVTPAARHDLSDVAAMYWRQYDFEQVLGLEVGERGGDRWRKAAAFEESMTLVAQHACGTIVNRPASIGSNHSKPYQLELIRRAGLNVPATLISTEPDEVIEFWNTHGAVIYKSISSCRSIVAQLQESDLGSLDAVTCCPTQFQQYVRGTDYRVHVIGADVFAHRIVSAADDYRYSEETLVESADLPDAIAERCVHATQLLGLDFSGVDLRRSPDGEWFCFEINPSPGFTYFDRDQRVEEALARYLCRDPMHA